ncbi:MAG: adenylyl-sulfate kinase [Planctomycetales bacterium]|nr:adenylyl-sulfate kinase [Planctomycetales bacterium]
MTEDPRVVWHSHAVDRQQRTQLMGHQGCVLWFTGLSGSGKSTIANATDQLLAQRGVHTFLLDGDNIRHGLCAGPNLLEPEHGTEFAQRFGLGFGAADREENIRRIGCVAQLMASAGLVVLTAFVSPYRRDRDRVRQWVNSHGEDGDFIEVFVDTPLAVCEQRDPKGLYKLARQGEIKNFTGISDPYEPPISPEIHLREHNTQPQALAQSVIEQLMHRQILA